MWDNIIWHSSTYGISVVHTLTVVCLIPVCDKVCEATCDCLVVFSR